MNKKEMMRQLDDAIAKAIVEDLHLTFEQIAAKLGVSRGYVTDIAKARKIRRKPGLGSPAFKVKKQAQNQVN